MVKSRFAGLLLLAATGCYEAVPLTAAAPPAGSEVEVQLTDAGSAALAQVIGPNAASIRGHYDGTSGDTLRLRVLGVAKRNGNEDFWKQEGVGIPRTAIATVLQRKISGPRTGLVLALGIAAAALVRVGFSGTTNTTGTHRPPPAGQ